MDEPLLDGTGVGRLVEQVGPATLPALVASWKRDSGRAMVALRVAFLAGDRETLERSAHALRGGAATLGAARLLAIVSRIEEAGRATEAEIRHLEQTLKATEEALGNTTT